MHTEQLARLRKAKGLTQQQVAEQLELSRQAVSRWESGQAFPSTENLKKLSELYGVPVDELLHSTPEKPAEPQHPVQVSSPPEQRKTKKSLLPLVVILALLAALAVVFAMWYTHWEPGVRDLDSMEQEVWDYSDVIWFDMSW